MTWSTTNSLNAPERVSFTNGQSVSDHFKSFTNYVSQQSQLYADNTFARYYFNESFKTVTYSEIDRIATNLACKWSQDVRDTKVVAYLSDHTVDGLIVMLALMKLQVIMLAVSPRNSLAADVSLLEETKSKLLIASAKYQTIAEATALDVPGVNVILLDPFDIETLKKEPLHHRHQDILDYNFNDNDIIHDALIIHRYYILEHGFFFFLALIH